MPNQIDSIKLIDAELLGINKRLEESLSKVIQISKKAREMSGSFSNVKAPEELNNTLKISRDNTEQLNAEIKEQNRLEKLLISTKAKRKLAEESIAKSVAINKFEQQKQNKLLKEAAILSSRLSTELEKASVKRNKLARSIQDLNLKKELGFKLTIEENKLLLKNTKEFEKYNNAIKKAKNSVDRYFESVGKYPAKMGAASKSAAIFNNSLKNSSLLLRSAASSASGLASSMGLVGGAFLVGGVIKDAFNRIRDFDKSMFNLSGILRTNRSELKDLEDIIISVAGRSVRTSNEIADLAQSLITLGKTKEDVKQLLSPVTDLSLALDASADDAGEFLVQMLNTFGDSTESAREYADTIATIRTSTSLDFQKMRDSFQYLAPISKALNKDISYTGALIGILADNGIKAERAGRLLGTAQQKLAGEGKSLTNALDELNEAKRNNSTELELLALSSNLFGKQASSLGLILANNSDIIEKNAEAIRNNKGALNDLVNQQLKSLDASLKILSSRWEEYLLKQNDASKGSSKLQKAISFLSDNLETIIDTTVTVIKWFGIYKAAVLAGALVTKGAAIASTAYRLALITMRGGISKTILSLKALKVATASSGIGLLVVALGSAYELFQAFSSGASEAADNMKKLNKEMETFNKISNDYTAVASKYKKGVDQIGIAIEGQEKIINRVAEKLKQYGEVEADYNALHIREAKRLIREVSDKDISKIKEKIDLAATFSDKQKKYIINEIAGYQALSKVIKDNEEFLDKEEDKKARKQEKRISKRSEAYGLDKKIVSDILEITKEIEKTTSGILLPSFKEYDKDQGKEIVKTLKDVFKDDFSFEAPELETVKMEESLSRINEAVKEDLLKAFDKELLDDALKDLTGSIENFTGINASILDNFVKTISNGFSEIEDVASSSFNVIGEVADAFYSNSIANYDRDLEANNEYYENLLQNEELTDETKEKLEKDRRGKEDLIRKKQKEEQRKQAEINKAVAIADIILNTSKGITAALATANIPLSIAIGALGAAQLGIALSTEIPKFAEGGEMGYDGDMMINDHHTGRLEVVERNGQFLMTDKKNAIVQGKKGDIIHKDARDVFKHIPDKELTNNLDSYILMANVANNINTVSRIENKKSIDNQRRDTDRLIKAFKQSKQDIVIHNNNSIGEELAYFKAGDF